MGLGKGFGSVKRLGVRYGRRIRARLAQVEYLQKQKQACPFCHKYKVSRVAAGIYLCNGCKRKFAGGAYTIKGAILESALAEGEKTTPEEQLRLRESTPKESKEESSKEEITEEA
ncbi:50S ribosomal protein L37ae [Candidatus Woesearchaeota archaeon]|nr:50S ribosomal protein L37ae [Candidatus Woesearchaeota archaeon]